MRNLNVLLKNRKIDYSTLLEHGFVRQDASYSYISRLENTPFEIHILITEAEAISRLIDTETSSEYVLVDVEDISGEFTNRLKEQYLNHLMRLLDSITIPDAFHSSQTQEIINYAHLKYGTDPEFLWAKDPNSAVLRRMSDGKWYAALLTVKKSSLHLDGDGTLEIVDLHGSPERVEELLEKGKVLPAYHMNKKRWYTIILDNRLSTEEIIGLLDGSYETK